MKFDLYFRIRLSTMADDRVIALIEALGMEGWGTYTALLCELRLHPDNRCSFTSIGALARRWKVTPETLLSVITNFGLFSFHEEGEEVHRFSSDYLDEELQNLGSSRVSTTPNQSEPSPATPTPIKRGVPLTVKRATNGRFTAMPESIKNKREKEKERVEEPTTPPAVLLPGWEKHIDEAFTERSWIEVQAMHSGMGQLFIEQLPQVIAFFKRHVVIYGKESTILNMADAKNYFGNFIRQGTPMQRELHAILSKEANECQQNNPYRYEQRHPQTGERMYCGQPIPADAPPRPHENAVWSQTLRQWA